MIFPEAMSCGTRMISQSLTSMPETNEDDLRAKVLTKDEARCMARNIAKLVHLLKPKCCHERHLDCS